MSLADKLNGLTQPRQSTPHTEPLWEGPSGEGPNGGISYSALVRFLNCRERFRVYAIEGLRTQDQFLHRVEFGQMWHVCEEAHACGTPARRWEIDLADYARALLRRYSTTAEMIDHWYNVVKVTFPEYVKFWSKHKDVTSRRPLMQEQVFDVPYTLPSGRTVRLRGKFDAVDLIGTGQAAGVYLFETKTKGEINELQIKRQMRFDMQTCLYLVALDEFRELYAGKIAKEWPIRGVRYNVVRRPLSGGKGTIVRKKGSKTSQPESKEAFYKRVASYIEDEPQAYFMRWQVEVTPDDLTRFRRECLDPILEQLCDWYEWITGPNRDIQGPFVGSSVHWRHPFGIYNVLDEGGATDLDEYLDSGSTTGLTRVERLFTELET